MARDYKKEAEWSKTAYQEFRFKAKKSDGEADRLKTVMGDKSFGEWVREKIEEDEKYLKKV